MTPASLKIGISGVRGAASTALTPDIAASFAAAFGAYIGPRRIVIGADPRPSGAWLVPAVTSGLLSVGCTPVDLGMTPTPSLQHRLRATGAAGGIGVTGSHHPMDWNALKFFGSDGTILRPHRFAELLDLYHQRAYPRAAGADIARAETDPDAVARHLDAVCALVDAGRISRRAFHVAVDACNGAGSWAAPELLQRLGCRVTAVHADAGRPFPRDPEPRAEHLGALCAAVKAAGADVGFALDADADRLALVDENGRAPGEETTLALAVRHMLRRAPGPVVINLSTSRMVEDLAREAGVPVWRTPVGEAHVVERMHAVGAPVGGEGNGGVIVPAANAARDGFVAMALTLDAMAADPGTLGAICARLPRQVMIKRSIPCRMREAVPFLRQMRRLFEDCAPDLTDGVRVQWPDRWLHLRASQTEPVLRIVAEGRTRESAQALLDRVSEYFRPAAGGGG